MGERAKIKMVLPRILIALTCQSQSLLFCLADLVIHRISLSGRSAGKTSS